MLKYISYIASGVHQFEMCEQFVVENFRCIFFIRKVFYFFYSHEFLSLSYRGYQRAMVKSMTLAAKIPHFYYVEEMNCDALVELKTSFKNENSDPEIKHTFLPVLIKSLSMALTTHPMLNSCFSEESYEVILKGISNAKF